MEMFVDVGIFRRNAVKMLTDILVQQRRVVLWSLLSAHLAVARAFVYFVQ